MSAKSSNSGPCNLYEENLNEETTLNLSCRQLESVPSMTNELLCVLYLQNNNISALPEEFFPSLPSLMWLDLRNNYLTELPKSIKNHPSLTHLLLKDNKLTTLPDELGTVVSLKVLQLAGNPLNYPPKEIINAGVLKIVNFLYDKFVENMLTQSQLDLSDDAISSENTFGTEMRSYNSVLDQDKVKNKPLSVQLSERETIERDNKDEYHGRLKGKCPKLAKSRINIPHSQSSKYLKPIRADRKEVQDEKIKQSFLKDLLMKKHKDMLAKREKILQDRKNLELLKNWRKEYKNHQLLNKSSYKLDSKNFPYDTSPEYMTLLTREDIEKDLPDKYRKKLIRKPKPTYPRKNNSDVHLAMKIKQLFENLESIDLNKEQMTPRTEQKVLLNEIQKISEIKQKLMELSTNNMKSVVAD